MLLVAEHLLQLPNGPQELVVIGYSYGACIAANLMEHVPQVGRAACVSPQHNAAGSQQQQQQQQQQQHILLSICWLFKLQVDGSGSDVHLTATVVLS
jgi:dienelactone hydrolase